ncbi:MAG: hypothetical protein WKG07_19875 [Hymenobacter sp.]
MLTDAVRTPAAIAQRLLDYRFGHYEIVVGEDLDGPRERVGCYSLAQASKAEFLPLNCVLLRRDQHANPYGASTMPPSWGCPAGRV